MRAHDALPSGFEPAGPIARRLLRDIIVALPHEQQVVALEAFEERGIELGVDMVTATGAAERRSQ